MDWFSWGMGLVQGTIVSVIGGVVIFYFLIPPMTARTTKRTIEALKKDPEIKPLIDKAKEIINKLEPLVNQFKNIDLEKLQKDFTPLYEAIKKIDAEDIDGLLKALKDLTGMVTKAIEKPNVPKPDVM